MRLSPDTTEHEFATPTRVELVVELRSGSVLVEAADTDTTSVRVTGDDPERVTVGQRREVVAVRGPRHPTGFRDDGGAVDVVVRLPEGSVLAITCGSATVDVSGRVDGGRIKTGSGSVRVGLSDGPLLVETGSGAVEVGEATEPLRVKSGSGDVTVGRAASAVAVSAGSGDVRIRESHGATGVKTGSGDLSVEEAHDDVSLHSGSGDLRIGAMHRGCVTARGASGAVDVGIPPGIPVWTDVRTLSGRVDTQLSSRGEPGPDQDHVEVRATLVSGTVRLRDR